MTQSVILVALTGFTLASTPALGQEDGARIALEMLVFAHLDPEPTTEELRVVPPDLPAPVNYPAPAVLPDSGAATPQTPAGMLALTRAQHMLGSFWASMRRSAQYRPLAHFAWALPAGWNGEAAPMRLSTLSAKGLPFAGLASLEQERFIHLTLDLRLPDEEGAEGVFQLTGQRRLLLGELHYFDHPRFGAIVRLFRYRPHPQTDSES